MSSHPTLLKNFEIAFRRFLLRFLATLGRRGTRIPSDISYNSCKFLFVRQDRIGDVLILTPLLSLLKRQYPECTIDVLLSDKNHFVLAHSPHVRTRWVYRKRVLSSLKLLRDIRMEKYDFLIDPMDNPSTTSTVISLLSGAQWRVGLSKENSYAYDIVVPRLSRQDTHIVDRMAELLRVFNIEPSEHTLKVEYSVSSSSERFASEAFHTLQLDGKVVVGINISAGHDTRFWGIEKFRDLIRLMGSAHADHRQLILYKPSDKPRAERIAEGFPHVVLSPPTASFDEFAALVGRLHFLVTPDTSAVHLAAAFQIPSVVLYVQSNKELNIWRPYGSLCEALIADVDDLGVISPHQVFEAWLRLRSTVMFSQTDSNVSRAS